MGGNCTQANNYLSARGNTKQNGWPFLPRLALNDPPPSLSGLSLVLHNIRHISWHSCDVLCPPNVGFYELASQKAEIQHWKGRNTMFCWNMGVARCVPTPGDEDCYVVVLGFS